MPRRGSGHGSVVGSKRVSQGVLGASESHPRPCFRLVTDPEFPVMAEAVVQLVSNGAQLYWTHGVQRNTRGKRIVQHENTIRADDGWP